MPTNISVVGSANADPGGGSNPVVVNYTPISGNTILVVYQVGDDVTFTSITDSVGTNTWVNLPNSIYYLTPDNPIFMGASICYSFSNPGNINRAFNMNCSAASAIYQTVCLVEMSNVGGLDQAPAGVHNLNTGSAGATVNGATINTSYPLEIILGWGAPDNGLAAITSGWTGLSTPIGGGGGGVGFSYQLVTSKGSYTAGQFTDSVANDDFGMLGWSFYAKGQSWTYVQGNNTVVQTGSSHTSISVTLTNTPAQGDLLVAVVTPADTVSVTIGTIQDNNSNVYTVIDSMPFNVNYGQAVIAYLIAPSNAGKTITCTVSTSSGAVNAIWVDEFNPNGNTIVVGTPQVASSTSPASGPPYVITSPPSLTVLFNQLGYAVCCCDSGFGTSPTLNLPWVLGGNLPLSGANDFQLGAYVLSTTAGTLDMSFDDVAPNDDYGAIMVAFYFASASSGGFAGFITYIGH
jgi:hypothetical protein